MKKGPEYKAKILIDKVLYERLRVIAKHHNRSINGEGVYAIIKHLEESETAILAEEARRNELLSKLEIMDQENAYPKKEGGPHGSNQLCS